MIGKILLKYRKNKNKKMLGKIGENCEIFDDVEFRK